MLKSLKTWWRTPSQTTNGRHITTMLGVIGIGFISLGGLWRESSERDKQQEIEDAEDKLLRCQQRVEGRENIRLVILDIYDFAERATESEEVQELRERLDRILPSLALDDCLAEVSEDRE